MHQRIGFGLAVLSGLVLVIGGCQGGLPPGDLDNLTIDVDGDGFPEITPPEGVSFEEVGSLQVELVNLVGQQQLAALASDMGLDPSLLSLVRVSAELTITLEYDGVTQELTDSELLEPFEKRFEVACPNAVSIEGVVVGDIPVVGRERFSDFAVQITRDQFECGQTLRIETDIDENGLPSADIEVLD